MTDLNSKNKHLTDDERRDIMECLNKGVSFKDIARRLGKAATTVSREVKKHLAVQPLSVKQNQVDGKGICPLLLKSPFVCNNCKKRRYHCGFQKQLYIAQNAQSEYKTLLREAREGIPFSGLHYRRRYQKRAAPLSHNGIKQHRLFQILRLPPLAQRVSVGEQNGFSEGGQVQVAKAASPRLCPQSSQGRTYTRGLPQFCR